MRNSDWSSDVCSSDLTSNPFADVGRRTVSVQVTSVVRASDTSFQVKWTERAYERGSLAGTSRWTAMLTVKVQPPRSADVLRKNPLGLYVDAIDWSRELDTPVLSPVEGDALKSLDHFPMPGELEIGRASCRERVCKYV